MKKTYEKPFVRDLSEFAFAQGVCNSGLVVGSCNTAFGVTAGDCTSGIHAGTGRCSAGTTPIDTCNYGNFGIHGGDCTPGSIAAP